MVTQFPAQIDNSITLPSVIDNITPVSGATVNTLRDAIVAVEQTLGIKPQSIYSTVRNRLDFLESLVNSIVGGTGVIVIGTPQTGQAIVWSGAAWIPSTNFGSQGISLEGKASSNQPLSNLGQGAIYFDNVQNKFLVSENGGAYEPLGAADVNYAGDLSGNSTSQTVVGIRDVPVNISDLTLGSPGQALVYNGTNWTASTSQNIFTTGQLTSGPLLSTSSTTGLLELNGKFLVNGVVASTLSNAGQGAIYFDSTQNKFLMSQNGGNYIPIQIVFNVKDYGATGNGSTDDTTAIQNTINAAVAADGGTVYFPVGTYAHTGLTIGSAAPITLKGEGALVTNHYGFGDSRWATAVVGTALRCTSTSNDCIALTGTDVYQVVHVEDLALIGPGSNPTSGFNFGSSSEAQIGVFKNVMVANFYYGVTMGDAEDCAFYSLYTYGCNVGLYVNNGATDLRFYDFQAQACSQAALLISGGGLSFYGGLVQSNSYGFVFEPASNFDRTSISGFWFENNTSGSVILNTTSGTIQDVSISHCRFSDSYGINFSGGDTCSRLQLGPNLQAKQVNITLPGNAESTKLVGAYFNSITNNGSNTLILDPDMGFIVPYTNNIVSNYPVVTSDYVLLIRSLVGAITVTLPSSPNPGRTLIVADKDGNAASNNITISGNGNNINGASTYIINNNYGSIQLLYNGSTWTTTSIDVSGAASGDLTGFYPSPTVAAIRGNSVQAGALGASQDGYVLTWKNSAGLLEFLPSSDTISLAGDVTGAADANTVISITGSSGSVNIAATGNVITWNSATNAPGITQASTSSASGANMTIQAQGATGSGHGGGNLILAPGASGSASAGTIELNGSQNIVVSSLKISNYNVVKGDYLIAVGTLTSSITVTLPSSPGTGDVYKVKDVNGSSGTYNIVIGGNGNNIDGGSTYTLVTNYAAVTVAFTGTQWSVL